MIFKLKKLGNNQFFPIVWIFEWLRFAILPVTLWNNCKSVAYHDVQNGRFNLLTISSSYSVCKFLIWDIDLFHFYCQRFFPPFNAPAYSLSANFRNFTYLRQIVSHIVFEKCKLLFMVYEGCRYNIWSLLLLPPQAKSGKIQPDFVITENYTCIFSTPHLPTFRSVNSTPRR